MLQLRLIVAYAEGLPVFSDHLACLHKTFRKLLDSHFLAARCPFDHQTVDFWNSHDTVDSLLPLRVITGYFYDMAGLQLIVRLLRFGALIRKQVVFIYYRNARKLLKFWEASSCK